jgi:hypothetical protein
MRRTMNAGLLGLAGLGVLASGASAAELGYLPSIVGSYRMGVTSIKEARFRRVIKQQYDFSCGSAALATLLSYRYDPPGGRAGRFRVDVREWQ